MLKIFKRIWDLYKEYQDIASIVGPLLITGFTFWWAFITHQSGVIVFTCAFCVFVFSLRLCYFLDDIVEKFYLDSPDRGIVVKFLDARIKEIDILENSVLLNPETDYDQTFGFFHRYYYECRTHIEYFYSHWRSEKEENVFSKNFLGLEVESRKRQEELPEKFRPKKSNNCFQKVLGGDNACLRMTRFSIKRYDLPKDFDSKIIPYLKRNLKVTLKIVPLKKKFIFW